MLGILFHLNLLVLRLHLHYFLGSPTAMFQSKDIVSSCPLISNTIAGTTKDSTYIVGKKEKIGLLWDYYCQGTENLMSSLT